MKRILIYLLIAILGTALYYYYSLGGFKDPVLTQETTGPYFIAGQYYEGKVDDKALNALFERTEQMAKKEQLPGQPAALFYADPDKNNGNIQAFVGVIIKDTALLLPDSFEIRTVPAQEVIKGNLEAHYTIVPVDVYQEVKKYARENKLTVSDTTLEIYSSRENLIVEVPVTGTLNTQ